MAKKKQEEVEQTIEVASVDYGFSDKDVVTIIATKDSKHLQEGQVFNVSGNVAKILIGKGIAKIK
jgi:hypothetical protein